MEAIEAGPYPTRSGWISRLVEVLQPVSVRADRLGSMALFAGLSWTELEFAAGVLRETLIERGVRMTVQGKPAGRVWLILEGEALVSADARPLRVAGRGDMIGLLGMLREVASPESAVAISPIRAFETDRAGFASLAARRSIRRRLVAAEAAISAWNRRMSGAGRKS